ncbi:MAG: prephenate dehydrogenase/arogenate dehydrogenase family protein [Chloroflexota bacterium]
MDDEEKFVLSRAKIGIIGLGLMGGSLALALKGKCATLFGIDPDKATREMALNQNIVDFVDEDPSRLLPLVDLVILAAPVPAILALIGKLPEYCPNPCIVLDIGSAKVEIVEKMAQLPARFDPIGGHPICGRERLTIENADRTLYYSAPFILTPLSRTTSRARSASEQIIDAIGARMDIIDAIDHDRILAYTSHTPFLISSILALVTPQDVSHLIGPGFRSASRLAGTPSSMMLGVVFSNKQNILSALERFQDELALFISAISENDLDTVKTSLESAQRSYSNLTGGKS